MNSSDQNNSPPLWSLRLLRLFIRKDFLEEIEGDMEEVYMDDLALLSVRKARFRYIWQVFKLLRPALIRQFFNYEKLNYLGMFKHNLLVTLRGFKRHKLTFFINLTGLSTGLAAALLIYLWVNDERSVDTFHEKDDRLYWAMTHFDINDGITTWDYTSGRLGAAMVEDFPEVEEAVRVGNHFFRPGGVISHKENNFEVSGLFASDNFFQVLSYDLIAGNPTTLLSDKQSVAISEELAQKAFGSVDKALNAEIEWENTMFNRSFAVKGVFKSPPANASTQFDIVVNYELLIEIDKWSDAWNGGYARNFLVLKEGTDIEAFNEKIAEYMDGKIDSDRFTLFVQKYSERYLYGEYESGILTGGRIDNVRLFTVIAIFILVIACINFMNLSTAQASKKMKEIGVKKAIGAQRKALMFQFLSESVLLALFALAVAIALVYLCLLQFNYITSKTLSFDLAQHILPLLIIVLGTGLLAGSYPAFYLSGFKPVAVLKGKMSNLKGEEWIRKGLVVVQFALSIIFIIGVITINQQIEFTQNRQLGYNRENIVTFSRKGSDTRDPQPLLTELKKIPGVISVANMAGDFLWGNDSGSGYSWQDGDADDNYLFKSPKIGYDVIETLGLEIVAGRAYHRDFNDHRERVILNESAVKMMGLENPVGTMLGYGKGTREVIGVVKDFQYGSLHQKVEPLLFRFRDWGRQFLVKIQAGTEVATLQQMEKVYKTFHPKYDFEASFLSDDYTALYDAENKVAQLSNYMAGIAIIISCLGLFGLAAFTAERRTKEIGIRKILGAGQLTIMRILTGSCTRTVLISIILAIPAGYFMANSWLQNFAYAIDLHWWIFVLSGLSAMGIAWLTVGFQTLKAANINPVECLRHE